MHRLGRSRLVTQNVLHLGAAGRICSSLRVRQREVSSIIPFTWARRKQELSPAVPQTVPEKTASSDPKSLHSEKRMEKFIPVTRGVLVSKLMAEDGLLNWQEKRLLENFAAALDAFFSQRFYAMLEETKLLYDSLDPDKDTIKTKQLTKKELLDQEYWLLQKVDWLLEKANYFEVPESRLAELLQDHDAQGLKVSVDPSAYETLRMWTRGKTMEKPSPVQRIQSLMRRKTGVTASSNVFTRVFVAVRSKSEKRLHLKVFKEVPCNKLEYLVPDGKIKMSTFDKRFLGLSVVVGASSVAVRSLPVLTDYVSQWTWIGFGLAVLVGLRAWSGYKNKRNQYLANLSKTLYFKTVSNNRGVLTLLTDRAQDEEFKEAMLAYTFLLSPQNRRGVPGTEHTAQPPVYDTHSSLQARINEWLANSFNLKGLQFDIEDALDKLDNLGLLKHHDNGTLSVCGIEEAVAILPCPAYHWQTVGVLRDSENSDEHVPDSEPASLGWR